MRMFYVSGQATKQVAARLREGEADDVAGYVIDLRNNPGGQALYIYVLANVLSAHG